MDSMALESDGAISGAVDDIHRPPCGSSNPRCRLNPAHMSPGTPLRMFVAAKREITKHCHQKKDNTLWCCHTWSTLWWVLGGGGL